MNNLKCPKCGEKLVCFGGRWFCGHVVEPHSYRDLKGEMQHFAWVTPKCGFIDEKLLCDFQNLNAPTVARK